MTWLDSFHVSSFQHLHGHYKRLHNFGCSCSSNIHGIYLFLLCPNNWRLRHHNCSKSDLLYWRHYFFPLLLDCDQERNVPSSYTCLRDWEILQAISGIYNTNYWYRNILLQIKNMLKFWYCKDKYRIFSRDDLLDLPFVWILHSVLVLHFTPKQVYRLRWKFHLVLRSSPGIKSMINCDLWWKRSITSRYESNLHCMIKCGIWSWSRRWEIRCNGKTNLKFTGQFLL